MFWYVVILFQNFSQPVESCLKFLLVLFFLNFLTISAVGLSDKQLRYPNLTPFCFFRLATVLFRNYDWHVAFSVFHKSHWFIYRCLIKEFWCSTQWTCSRILATRQCSIRTLLPDLTLTHVSNLSLRRFLSVWCCPISYLIESLIMSNRTWRFAIFRCYVRTNLWVLGKMSDLFLWTLLFRESIKDQRYSVKLFFFPMT